jgi:DNA-binding CsgD family transcriptional regulator
VSEVLRQAVLGRSTKEIAFDLHLSASTVGVLLWRGARKLGVRTRAGLLHLARAVCLDPPRR